MGRASHASIFGASPCGNSLVLLGACGPRHGTPGIVGQIINSPWAATQAGLQPAALSWKVSGKAPVGPPPPPGAWQDLLPRLHEGLESQPAACSLVHLTPLLLGGRLVGALLCGQAAQAPEGPCPPVSSAPGTPRPGAGSDGSGRCRLLRLSESPGVLMDVSAVLVDCLLAPHADSVRQVCAAAHALAHAPDIATLASVLSSTVADSLSAQLHVDLAVRPVLVPAPSSFAGGGALPCGFLLLERWPPGTVQSQLPLSSTHDAVQLQTQRSLGPSGADLRMSSHTLVTERGEAGGLLERGISVTSQQMGPERSPVSLTASRGPDGRPVASGTLSPQHMDIRSFLISCGEDAVMSDNALATAEELLAQPSFGGADRSRLTLKALKAVPFPLATALVGSALRGDLYSSSQAAIAAAYVSTSKASLPAKGYGSASIQRSNGNQSILNSTPGPSPDTLTFPASTGRTTCAARTGVVSIVLPDLHLHLQDVDQPSGDLFLLFGGRRGQGVAMGGGGASCPAPPACLVLLMAAGANAPGTGTGMGARPPQTLYSAARDGVGGRTDGSEGTSSNRGPSVALFMTCTDRLPMSLLRAARDYGTRLFEMLLPACMDALTDGAAGLELEDMALLMLARSQKALPSTSDVKDPVGSQLPSGTTPLNMPQGFDRPSPAVATFQSPLASFTAITFNFEQPGPTGRAGFPGVQAPFRPPLPPPLPKANIQKAPSRSSMLSRGGSIMQQNTFTPAPGGSVSDVREPRSFEPCPPSAAGMVVRRLTDLLPAMSPTTKASGPRGSATAEIFRNVVHAVPHVRAPGSSGFRPRARTDLLDLENLGGPGLEPQLPDMEMLLASFYSTLNEVENEPSPYCTEDLCFLRIVRVIGEGGCSVVYLGRLLGLEVAVKLLHPIESDEETALEDCSVDPNYSPVPGVATVAPQQPLQGAPTATATATPAAAAPSDTAAPVEPSAASEAEPAGQFMAPAPTEKEPFWVKARQARLRDLMRGVRELAVMSSISHPNIVQIYSYHTSIAVTPPTTSNGMPTLQAKSEYEDPSNPNSAPHVAIIMEFCDIGSLADALDSGRFKEAIMDAATSASGGATSSRMIRTSSGYNQTFALLRATAAHDLDQRRAASISAQRTGGVAMRAIYLTLLEVALALRHLHFKNLVHCDVKAANVMLKSSASDPRGFTCKLGDFGLVHVVLKEGKGVMQPAQQDSAVGTVTHLAPEYFSPGAKLTFAADIYAFGVVMWEVFTGKPPYMEFAAQNFRDLPYLVAQEGLRPKWPPHTPPAYRTLAAACWAADPAERPNAAGVVTALQRLMEP